MGRFNFFYFLLYVTWSSVYTLANLYMDEVIGLNLGQIGLIAAVLPLISLFFQPLWGAFSDFSGKRKTVLQGLLVMNAIIACIVTVVTKDLLFVGLYFIYQVFLCGQGPLIDSMAIQAVSEDSKRSYGAIRVWGSIGYALGAFFVALIANQFGLKWIFYLAAIGYFLSLLVTFKLQNRQVKVQNSVFKSDLKLLMKQKNYLFILLYSFFLVGSFFGSDQYLGLYIRSTGVEVSKLGLLTFLSVCVEIPFIFYSKRLVSNFGAVKLLIFMNLLAILRMAILGIGGTLWVFAVAGVLRGAIVGIFIPLFVELIVEITPKAVVTSAVAIYSATSSGIANFIFTLIGGQVADRFGFEGLFFSYGFVMLVPLLLAIRISKMKRDT